jgi:hypothetical protein
MLIALLVALAGSPEAPPPALSPAQIEEAIAAATPGSCYPIQGNGMTFKPGEYPGCFSTPFSRVSGAAARAAERFETFTPKSVTAEMVAPVLRVTAFPIKGSRPMDVDSVVQVVLVPRDGDRAKAIKPTATEPTSHVYRNAHGASITANGLIATFPLSALSPDYEVRFILAGGGYMTGHWELAGVK